MLRWAKNVKCRMCLHLCTCLCLFETPTITGVDLISEFEGTLIFLWHGGVWRINSMPLVWAYWNLCSHALMAHEFFLLIHGFSPVNAWLLIACSPAFYAIITNRGPDHTVNKTLAQLFLSLKCQKVFFGHWDSFAFNLKSWSCSTKICPAFANSVDSDQLASSEANRSGSALFVILNVNLYQQPGSSNLIQLTMRSGLGILIYSAWLGLTFFGWSQLDNKWVYYIYILLL